MSTAPPPVDPSKIPALSGVFTPQLEEHDLADLAVQGELPDDLRGTYVRNGPNPLFPPLGSYTYPLEGDAMLHALHVDDDGRPATATASCGHRSSRVEQQAGHALWAGLMTPYLPGPDVVPEQYANDFKPQPFINIVHHGGPLVGDVGGRSALGGHQPVRGGERRAVHLGRCDPRCVCPPADRPGHGRDGACSATTWASRTSRGRRSGADGTVTHTPDPIDIDGSYMIHDFVITADHLVLFVGPAKFDLNALLTGSGPPLGWHPDQPLRIAVIPRAGTSKDVQWIETDPFWVYHFANAFADGDDDRRRPSRSGRSSRSVPRRIRPAPPCGRASTPRRARSHWTRGSTASASSRASTIGSRARRTATSRCRGSTTSGPGPGTCLTRADTSTGAVTEWDSGAKVFDEVVFAPAWVAQSRRATT